MEQELRISQRAKQYPASGIRKMFDLAAQYPEAIKLTVGEPNFDTPQYIKDAAKRALDEGQTHYAPNAGTTELREAVAAKYRKQYWEGYTKDHVIITVGAMEGLFLAMMTLLDPGDEILVPDPCFPNYYGQASSIGARAVPVPTYEEYDYRIQAADIEKAVTPRTRAILLNSPCNPTGAVLTKEDILAIAKVAKTHDLWVLTDEPYDAIVYDGIQPYSMAQVPEMQDRVMVLNSFSKSYAMTGWGLSGSAGAGVHQENGAAAGGGGLLCVHLHPGGGGGGPEEHGVRGPDGGGLHPPPGHSGGRTQRYPRHHLQEVRGQLLRLPQHQGIRQDLPSVCGGAAGERRSGDGARLRLRRHGRGLSAAGIRQLRRKPEGGGAQDRRLCGPGLSRYKVSSLECRPLPRSGQRTVLRQ